MPGLLNGLLCRLRLVQLISCLEFRVWNFALRVWFSRVLASLEDTSRNRARALSGFSVYGIVGW